MSESIGLDVEDVDLFQFVDVSFKIRVKMVDTVSGSVKTGQMSTIKVLLGFEGNTTADTRCREHHPHLLEVVSNTGIQENGCGVIEVKITDVSMNHDHQRFVIYLEAYRTHGENNILLAATNPITCVRHKLLISESNSHPYIWYKDEGAKDKCIKVLVKLVDANKNIVKERNVPLAVSLVYSSGQTVQPTTVLSIFNDKDKPLMVSSSGSELVKFRVNEVSRNHRKQLFHLLVAPDTSQDPSLGDVSPATSVAFEVKSKRTSDARKEHANLRGDEDDSTDAIPLPQSRLNELASVQPLKRMKLDGVNSIGLSSSAAPSTAGAAPAAQPFASLAAGGLGSLGLGMSGVGNGGKLDSVNGRGGLNDFKGAVDPTNRMMNAAAMGSIPGMAAGLAGMRNMLGNNMMNVGMFPGASALGMRDDMPEELSYEIPFKAIYSLAEWTNVAVNALSAANHVLNNIDNHDPYNSNAIEIQQSIVQLVETYPGRAHSCLQYLQQFLALQEQRALQQMQLLAMMQQEQQSFRIQLDSLVPQRGAGQVGNNGVMPSMLGTPRGNAGLGGVMTGNAGLGVLNAGLLGASSQGNIGLAFQQQQVAAAAQQAAQQQQQLMNAANLLSRGMRRDGSMPQNNTTNLSSTSNPIPNGNQMNAAGLAAAASASLRHLNGNNSSNSNNTDAFSAANINVNMNHNNTANVGLTSGSGLSRVSQQMQQQLQSLQQLAAAAIVDLNSSGGSTTTNGAASTPSSSSATNTLHSDHNNNNSSNSANGNSNNGDSTTSEAQVTNILGKQMFLINDNELLGLPAFSSHTSPDLRLIGFYLDEKSGRHNQTDEAGWSYRSINQIDAFQDPNRSKILSKLIVEQWKDPNNRQDGICFDVYAYENNLTAMKKSISLILQELEENEVSNTHFLSA